MAAASLLLLLLLLYLAHVLVPPAATGTHQGYMQLQVGSRNLNAAQSLRTGGAPMRWIALTPRQAWLQGQAAAQLGQPVAWRKFIAILSKANRLQQRH